MLFLLYYFYYQALKVVCFWHGQQDRVILGLGSSLNNHHIALRVVCGLGDDLEEERLGDVVGAGARDQVSARLRAASARAD